jgi:hypothetical protein
MPEAHTTLSFLPDRGFPIGTRKTQFLMYLSPIRPFPGFVRVQVHYTALGSGMQCL